LSPEKFNDYLKEACQAVGFTDKGILSTEPAKELGRQFVFGRIFDN
jgi:hypothetical protein